MSDPSPAPDRADAFRTLYEAVYPDLLRFVQRRTNENVAEDVVADAFLVVSLTLSGGVAYPQAMTKKKVLLAGLSAAVTALLIGAFIWGWDGGSALIAIGCGLGASLGVRWGNKKAKEPDAYREEWLEKRKRQRGQPHE